VDTALGQRLVRDLQKKRLQSESNGIRRCPHSRSRKWTTGIAEHSVDVEIRVVDQDEDVIRHRLVEFATLKDLLASRNTIIPRAFLAVDLAAPAAEQLFLCIEQDRELRVCVI
jgi:hypothetical protein